MIKKMLLICVLTVSLLLMSCGPGKELPPEPGETKGGAIAGQAYSAGLEVAGYADPTGVFTINDHTPYNFYEQGVENGEIIGQVTNEDYIYYKGQRTDTNGNFVEFEIGEPTAGNWIENNAEFRITLQRGEFNAGENTVILIGCSKTDDGGWDCHQGDCEGFPGPGCQHRWMAHSFEIACDTDADCPLFNPPDDYQCIENHCVQAGDMGQIRVTPPDAGGVGVPPESDLPPLPGQESCASRQGICYESISDCSGEEIQVIDNTYDCLSPYNFCCVETRSPGPMMGAGGGSGYARGADTDSDGFPDATDNCPQMFNTDQEDTDGDGVGDACDNVEAQGGGGTSGHGESAICGNCILEEGEECDCDQFGGATCESLGLGEPISASGLGCISGCTIDRSMCSGYENYVPQPPMEDERLPLEAELVDEICNNGIDDDGDYNADCYDNDCEGEIAAVLGEEGCLLEEGCICNPTMETECTDGFDNNGNGEVDCDDYNCENTPACAAQE